VNVRDAVLSRRSIRRYQDRPVDPDKLGRVLDAGRYAPTAKNLQKVRTVVVTDPGLRQQISEVAGAQRHVAEAPVLLVLCGGDPDFIMSCGYPAFVVDGVIAGTQMTLQATEEGLGTCWIARFQEPKVRALLGIPDDWRVVQILTLGYAASQPRPIERLPMSQFRKDNGWG
jgi:nitroreductase